MKNPVNMVLLYDGIEVQMPTSKAADAIVYVKCESGKYTLSDKDEYEKELTLAKRVKVKPKIEEVEKEINSD